MFFEYQEISNGIYYSLTKHVMISVSENGDFTTNKLQDW